LALVNKPTASQFMSFSNFGMIAIGDDLQPGCLPGRLLFGVGKPQKIHKFTKKGVRTQAESTIAHNMFGQIKMEIRGTIVGIRSISKKRGGKPRMIR